MPGLRPFSPIISSNRDLQLIQKELQNVLGPVTASALLTGAGHSVTFAKAETDVIVGHGLGSTNVAWLAGTLSAAGTIYTSPTAATSNTIILRASAPLTAQVWVYLVN